MKSKVITKRATAATPAARRVSLFAAAALLTLGSLPSSLWANQYGSDDYQQTNLVSDQPGVAMLQDTNLLNAWGISFSPTSPFWVSGGGSGLALVYAVTYDTNGMVQVAKQAVQPAIPGEGNPTGQAWNGSPAFHTNIFIFVSEDGTISGWRPALGASAEVLVSRTNANYKGMTIVSNAMGPVLLAANFSEGTVDAYDGNLNLVGQFADPKAAKHYAPFNVQVIEGLIFVTFAKQDAEKHDDVPGPGHGIIDVLDLASGKFHRFATGKDAGGKLKEINSPWGLALSPITFGKHADQLLVGNFGSGTIMAFEAGGDFDGLLEDADSKEKPLVIDGLWGLTFGNGGRGGRPGTLYFSAGPDDESHGLFGAIDVAPEEPRHGHGHGHGHGHDHDHR
jgi:uncharacterized protein (TIGR03118 family)